VSGKTLTFVLVSAAAVALTGGIGMALASGGEISHPTTIHAVAKINAFGDATARPGDPSHVANSYALSGSLWNTSQTRRIGRIDVACTVTTTIGDRALCDATFTLAGRGEISASGVSLTNGAPDTDPITGGDGQFRNVRGQVEVGDSNSPTISITLELEP
jgi:hypothetical protein